MTHCLVALRSSFRAVAKYLFTGLIYINIYKSIYWGTWQASSSDWLLQLVIEMTHCWWVIICCSLAPTRRWSRGSKRGSDWWWLDDRHDVWVDWQAVIARRRMRRRILSAMTHNNDSYQLDEMNDWAECKSNLKNHQKWRKSRFS